MKLYHVSKTPNLTTLNPAVSTHNKPYVYATPFINLALLFGGDSHGDFDGIYGTQANTNLPYFYEAFKGSFKNRFENETCYVYEVDPTNFKQGETSFKAELVSTEPVKVLNSYKIENLYSYFQQAIHQNQFIFKAYDGNDKAYVDKINSHIKDRIIRFNIVENKGSRNYQFCQKHFPNILKECEGQR